MTRLDIIKNKLIDRIMLSKDERLLNEINEILTSKQSDEIFKLNSYQLEMLELSEKDINEGNLTSEEDLDKEDSEWLG